MLKRSSISFLKGFGVLVFLVGAYPLIGFAETSKLLLSEIQISEGSEKYDHDFVEIYNQTDTAVSLDKIRLSKLSSSGKEYSLRVFPEGLFIAPQGYFVWANSKDGYAESIGAEVSSSATLSEDSVIMLCEGVCSETNNRIDLVGVGSAFQSEGESVSNPTEATSVSRKKITDTLQDTDNNKSDFVENCEPSPGSDGFKPCDKNDSSWNGVGTLRLNEILPDPSGDDNVGEFIELYNYGYENIDLSGWSLRDASNGFLQFGTNITILPDGFFFVQAPNIKFSLNNDKEIIYLIDPTGKQVDSFSYDSTQENHSWNYDSNAWYLSSQATLGAKNSAQEKDTSIEDKNVIDGLLTIRLNEIFPDPKGSDKESEFIEILNYGTEDIDLFGWMIRDASKDGKKEFKEHVKIPSGEYFILRSPDIGFALNNEKENITLWSPKGMKTDEFSYQNSKENISWSFDGESWKMSSHKTPGEENVFDKSPKAKKVKIPKKAYKNAYIDFSVETKGKVRWDFGDGHKSATKIVKHKYEKNGTYKVTLRVIGKSADYIKKQSIRVTNYPQYDVKISEVMPNPEGNDTENEYIVLENMTGKKLNLHGWSVATGSEKENVTNHPIVSDLEVEDGETVTVSRVDAKFSLPNEKGYVELRTPDKQMVHSMEYGLDGEVQEGEIFVRARKSDKGFVAVANASVAASPLNEESETSTEDIKNETLADPGEVQSSDTVEMNTKNEKKLYCEKKNPSVEIPSLREEVTESAKKGVLEKKERWWYSPASFFHSLLSGIMGSDEKV